MFQLISEVTQILPRLHGAMAYYWALRTRLRNFGAIPGLRIPGLWAQGRGAAPTRTHSHIHSLTYRMRSQSTDGHTRSAQTQKRAPTNTYLTHPPTSHHKHPGARHLTHLVHSCTHTTHRRTGELTFMCTLARTRSHPVHTPFYASTFSHAHAHIRAHTFITRAYTLLRTHTPSCPCTHPRAHAHTAERRRGAGRERPPVPGRVRPGEGAARGRRLAPELFARARAARRSEGARPAPARVGSARLGWAARRERARGYARAREWRAAGRAPWTPRRAAARRMTVWTRAPRPEGESRRARPWAGSAPQVARRLLPSPGLLWTASAEPAPPRWDGAVGAAPLAGPPGELEGLWRARSLLGRP